RASEGLPTSTILLGSAPESVEQTSVNQPLRSTPPPLPVPAAQMTSAVAPPAQIPTAPIADLAAVAQRASSEFPAVAPVVDTPPAVEEDGHDDFFSAGERGTYEGGHAHSAPISVGPQSFDDLGAAEEYRRRVVRRTPEQEARRERFIRVVSLIVGIGLAMACVALWRSHHQAPNAEIKPSTEPSVTVAPLQEVPPPTAKVELTAPVPPPPAVDVPPVPADSPLLPKASAEPAVTAEPAPIEAATAPSTAAASKPIATPKEAEQVGKTTPAVRSPSTTERAPAAPREPKESKPAPAAPPSPPPAGDGRPPTASFPLN
ncbi:MAG TPA: hypothetical protein VGM44_07885, partial [Polyangiaceae bacterium]